MNDLPEDIEPKSKSQIKAEMHELQELGEALLKLPESIYCTFPIPEELDRAIAGARKISAHGARRRQLQLIGKIMRHIDTTEISAAYTAWQTGLKQAAREHHQVEKIRDELISGNKETLDRVIAKYPGCDIQQLRQLTRLAQSEAEQHKPPKYYRKLFQFLKEL